MKLNFTLTPEKVQQVFAKKDYRFFENGNYNLNIFGIRATERNTNTFNDLICVMYKEAGVMQLRQFAATTDPGEYWVKNPMSSGGCAAMVEGQYLSAYTIGKHFGTDALVQVAPVKCYRDNDKDGIMRYDKASITEGLYGINIHSAWAVERANTVDKWSAGCQVFQNRAEFKSFIALCNKAMKSGMGSTFTYTLFYEADFE